ncbi:MAG TPA: SDR family NAD(P)-dependent oxidoreductase, partial [Candidatus Xenobia bacterium]
CVAGVFSLADALALVAARGRLMGALPPGGAMAAVRSGEAEVRAMLNGEPVSLAAVNGPQSVVVSGEEPGVTALCTRLAAAGVDTRRLTVSHAFHSGLMDPMLAEYETVAARVTYALPSLPLVSNLSGARAGEEVTRPEYWARQVREAVRFADGVQAVAALGVDVFLEMGPQPVLLGMGAGCVPMDRYAWVPSLRRQQDDWTTLLDSLGQLYLRGASLDWTAFCGPWGGRQISLPTYAWQHKRYWLDLGTGARPARRSGGHPLLGTGTALAARAGTWLWQSHLDLADQPWLGDHRLVETVVLPGTAYLEMALAAAREIFEADQGHVEAMEFLKAMILVPGASLQVQVLCTEEAPDRVALQVSSRPADGAWVENARGVLVKTVAAVRPTTSLDGLHERCPRAESGADLYPRLAAQGMNYGPAFQGLRRVWGGEDEALGDIRPAETGAADFILHPALLDACFHTLLAVLPAPLTTVPVVPVGVGALTVYQRPGPEVLAHWQGQLQPDGSLQGDVRLLDANGACLAEVVGLRLKGLAASPGRAPGEDLFLRLAWEQSALTESEPPVGPGCWIVMADAGGVGAAVIGALQARGESVVPVVPDGRAGPSPRSAQFLDPADPFGWDPILETVAYTGRPCRGVVHLWSLDEMPLEPAQVVGCGSTLHLVQGLSRTGWRDMPRLWLVTPAAQVAAAPLWGLGRTLAIEHPELRPTRVELSSEAPADDLLAELWAGAAEEEVAFRGDGRWVSRLVREAPPRGAAIAIRPDGTYLVTGGLGGLGLGVSQWLVDRGARHLILLSRKGAATPEMVSAVAELEAAGAQVRVEAVNVASRPGMQKVLSSVPGDLPLRGIVHTAGIVDDGVVLQQTVDRMQKVMAPKIMGAWHLHELTQDQPLDFFVMYSSATALLGSPGQATYSAANAFLDALAESRRRAGRPGLSVGWGPFSQVGMAAQAHRGDRLGQRGMESITPEQGLEALAWLLASPVAHCGVVPINIRHWMEFYPQTAGSSLLSRLKEESGRVAGGGEFRQKLLALPEEERLALVEQTVREHVAKVMRLELATVEPQTPLASLGMDSLMGLELRNRLESGLGLKLPATLVWTQPTVSQVAASLLSDLGAPVVVASSAAVETPVDTFTVDQLA